MKNGTIVLSTFSAAFIWEGEIVGQLSDGMWENAAPFDHWKFWHNLNVKVDATVKPHVEGNSTWADKTGYNIAGLYECVGDRMLATGRMGRALEKLGYGVPPESVARGELRHVCEDMAKMQYTEFLTAKEKDNAVRLAKVSLEVAASFYSTVYTMRDLRNDVRDIKIAMKSAKR